MFFLVVVRLNWLYSVLRFRKKGLKVLEVFSDFESRFGRFFLRHEAILALDKVFMFLCVVDVREYF